MRPITQSRMRRRRWLPAAFCLLCCLLFSGCTPGATVDSLLKPPSLSEEQQQIYLALQDAVGSGITLQYPRAGANLSAFTVVDLDGDGEDEALVFYKKTNLAAVENGLRLSVLDQVKGKWMSVCDRPADGTEVERIVVSAMGDTTDDLITKAAEITHNPSAREMDMLLAAGEEISIALLAMALNELGCHATSLTGWQAGFRTDRAYTKARITKLETERISSELERNRVVVVAGFQGLNKLDDITTLGRGGSDTSAVAIAAALHADRCQIFTDVEGVYTADPRKVRNTRKLDEITFDEMLELASLGAQVLNNRSVELAKKYNVELEVLSSLNPVPGTVVKEVVKDVEGMLIKGVAKDTDVAVITILNVPDEPGTSFKIFGLLAQKNINVDIILQSTGRDGKKDISFTCAESEAETALRVLRESAKFDQVTCDETCAKVSIVGAGMQSHSGVASKMFEALSNNNINIKMISTSEIKISCIIDRDDADKAVSAIHDMLFD